MNPYTVDWLWPAEDELTDIWLNSSDPQAITVAANGIDRQLTRDPINCGQDLSEGLRKLEISPLVVYFSVNPAQRQVEVSWVALCP